ncbi:MAG: hypothetical protein MUE40_21475, partial [Anaerolineae bacterium]|nr:hypothetical protein [Anaerolineae bacterium]
RAFLTRQPTIPAAVLAQYRSAAELDPAETPAPPPGPATTPRPNTETPPPAVPATDPAGVPPRWQRALLWALDAPRQMLAGLLLFAASGYSTPALWWLNTALALLFLLTGGRALFRLWRGRTPARWQERLAQTRDGQAVALLLFCAVPVAGLVLTRATPESQSTYYIGLVGPSMVLVAGGLFDLLRPLSGRLRRAAGGLPGLFLLIYCVGGAAERISRVMQYDDTRHTVQNVWLYRHIEAAVDYIAADWPPQARDPVIAYDFMSQLPDFWWLPAWGTVDPLYRAGTPYDFLLAVRHNLHNANQNPAGTAPQPDYVVIYAPQMEAAVSGWRATQFGTIIVLKPPPR